MRKFLIFCGVFGGFVALLSVYNIFAQTSQESVQNYYFTCSKEFADSNKDDMAKQNVFMLDSWNARKNPSYDANVNKNDSDITDEKGYQCIADIETHKGHTILYYGWVIDGNNQRFDSWYVH